MQDLGLLTGAEAKAMQTHLNQTYKGANVLRNVVNKIAQSIRISGTEHKVYPGIENINTAKYLPEGESIRPSSIKVTNKTLQLHRINNSWEFQDSMIRTVEPFMDTVQEVQQYLLGIWNATLIKALTEYILGSAGTVLPADTDFTTWDGKAFYHATHYDGRLNNIVTKTGSGPKDIMKDFWTGLVQLTNGLLPGSDIAYWEAVSEEELDIVIFYANSLREQMMNIFNAETFPAMIAGTVYNAPQSNILAGKRIRPYLVPSAYLEAASPGAWCAFLTSKSVSPSPQAIQMIFNPRKTTGADRSEGGKKGIPFEFGAIADKGIGSGEGGALKNGESANNNLFLLEWLGDGSPDWIKSSKAILSTSTRFTIFGANPYRSFIVK